MKALEVLTRLVVGTSRFGDHLLKKKVSGIVVAALAFACGAGLAQVLKRGPRTECVAVGSRFSAETTPAPHAKAIVATMMPLTFCLRR